MEYNDTNIFNSALKKKNSKLQNLNFYQPKVVRILEPKNSNLNNNFGETKLNNSNILYSKTSTFAKNPYDLLEGISDMFINAELCWDFTKQK